MSNYGLKETNDLVKFGLKCALMVAVAKKNNLGFSGFINGVKDSQEMAEMWDGLIDVPKEILDIRTDDIPELMKLLVGDYKWLMEEIKKIKE